MSVACPRCQTRVPFRVADGYGQVFTRVRGIPMCGTIDEHGVVHASDQSLYARYHLEGTEYKILVCAECGKEFVGGNSRPVWPLPNANAPSEIPEEVRGPFIEALKAHAVGAETAALLAARTSLIRMQREQKISRISDLVDNGKITKLIWGQADEVRAWANATGHEEAPPLPTREDVDQLLGYMRLLFDNVYVHQARLNALKRKRGKPD
jgi:hypothetical protein